MYLELKFGFIPNGKTYVSIAYSDIKFSNFEFFSKTCWWKAIKQWPL